jgi:hypothetical protein
MCVQLILDEHINRKMVLYLQIPVIHTPTMAIVDGIDQLLKVFSGFFFFQPSIGILCITENIINENMIL